VKAVIDEHITLNERYYKSVCYQYYNGRYLWEDLFQEFYLEFLNLKSDLVQKFHEANKLNYLGALVIRNIYSKRGQHKRYKVGETSPLFETVTIAENLNISLPQEDDTTIYDKVDFKLVQDRLAELKRNDWFKHEVLMLLQNESINGLSKRTNINRKYLTDTYKDTCNQLKKEIYGSLDKAR
jgi:hypothetical protein